MKKLPEDTEERQRGEYLSIIWKDFILSTILGLIIVSGWWLYKKYIG